MALLPRDFYARDTVAVARALLGQRLVHVVAGLRLGGLITETEAYVGEADRACHARAGRTRRTAVMYGPPGFAYVYLNYGVHWMLNIVTEDEGFPAAVLIRGLSPSEGLVRMRRNRPRTKDEALADGPGKLTRALSIAGALNGADLCRPDAALFVEAEPDPLPEAIRAGPRVGIRNVPEPWRGRPWNFRLLPSPPR